MRQNENHGRSHGLLARRHDYPWADGKEKMAASENIARYTLTKPTSKTKKEEDAEKALLLREQRKAAQFNIADDQHKTKEASTVTVNQAYKGKVPKWN